MSLPTTANIPPEEHFRSLSRAMALVLLEECYDSATADDAPFARKLDLLKLTTKLGDLEPKNIVAQQGTGFSIKIIFDDAEAEKVVSGVTVDNVVELDFSSPTPVFMSPSFTTDALATLPSPEYE